MSFPGDLDIVREICTVEFYNNMKAVELMIFDFDGTLVNSGNDLVSSVNYTLRQLNLPVLPGKTIIGFIGDGVRKLIERSLGKAFPERFEEALEIFTSYYRKHLMDTTTIYPGVKDVLNHFRDKKKIILTNKEYSFTVQITDAFNLTGFFEEIIGADSRPYLKPDNRLAQPIMEQYDVPPGLALVVGDGINDVLLAKNAGMISCAFLNGLGNREKLLSLQPDFVCESMTELMELFY